MPLFLLPMCFFSIQHLEISLRRQNLEWKIFLSIFKTWSKRQAIYYLRNNYYPTLKFDNKEYYRNQSETRPQNKDVNCDKGIRFTPTGTGMMNWKQQLFSPSILLSTRAILLIKSEEIFESTLNEWSFVCSACLTKF